MRYLKMAFGLVVVVGMMAVMASSAMALTGPRWVTCLKVVKGTFENNLCSKGSSGEWETSAVKETIEVTSDGTLVLEDEKPAAGGAVELECKGTNEGTIGANGSDSIRSVSASECKFIKNGGCTATESVTLKAINLGWATRLSVRNAKNEEVAEGAEGVEVRDELTSLVAGRKPGWEVFCHVDGILEIQDVCTNNTTTKIKSPGETVHPPAFESVFDSKSNEPKAECTSGKGKTGRAEGTVLFSARVGGALRAAWVLANVPGFPR